MALFSIEVVDISTGASYKLEESDRLFIDYGVKTKGLPHLIVRGSYAAPFPLEKISLDIVTKNLQVNIFSDGNLLRSLKAVLRKYNADIRSSPPTEALHFEVLGDIE